MNEEGKMLIQATEAIISNVKKQTDMIFPKLERMQEIYLAKNESLYSAKQLESIKRSFQSALMKFLLTDIHLEQVWSLSMVSRSTLFQTIVDSSNKIEWTENQKICGYLYLESFLFEARSFIDVLLRYFCLVLGKEVPGPIRLEKFYGYMNRVNPPFKNKSIKLTDYVKRVFSGDQWGAILRSLRDKIAHQEPLIPSYEGIEKISDVLLDWPTIRGKTFDRFCQKMENGLFDMVTELFPILFDLEWKSGPFRQTSGNEFKRIN